jgi:PAS domain S-box-containing protein
MRFLSSGKARLVSELEELKRKFAELQEAEYLLRIQRDLTLQLSGIDHLDEMLRLCLDMAIRVSGMDSGGIYLADERSGEWTLAVHSGLAPEFIARTSHFSADSANAKVMVSGRSRYVNYQKPEMALLTDEIKPEGIRALAVIPIPHKDRVIACLNVASHALDEVHPAARLSLETIAGQMGMGLVRARAEDALRESEKRYRDLTESLDVGIYRSTPDDGGRFLETNMAHVRMLGLESVEQLRQRRIVDIYESAADRRRFIDTLETFGFVRNREVRLRRADGSTIVVSISAVAVRGTEGRIESIDGIIEDVTERKAAEEALRTSEETYRALFEQSNDAVFLFRPDGRTLEANRKAESMLGRPKEEIVGAHFLDQIALSEREDATRRFALILQGAAVPLYERIVRRRDGSEFPAEVNISLVRDPDGAPLFVQSIVRDISERKKSEEAQRAALREKEVLLREIHHRVKNNMQVIISLLRLQSRTIEDEERRGIFKITQDRIRSMALVHEKLYQSRDLSGIDFKSYIQNLVSHLFNSAGPGVSHIRLELDLADIELNITKAVPCGLILNELISNALKYAFPGDRPGTIRIRLAEGAAGRTLLSVVDDGAGLPSSVDPRNPETLGLQIVNDLARQIDAEIGVDRTAGTSFTLIF